jgi:hypothetical protein
MEKIDLKLDEDNELVFKVVIEGTTSPASSIRFVCAGIYESRLEVLIEGKYISPLQVLTQFNPGVKIVAETVQRPVVKSTPQVQVTAVPIVARTAPKRAEQPAVEQAQTRPTKTLKERLAVKENSNKHAKQQQQGSTQDKRSDVLRLAREFLDQQNKE